MRIRITVVAFLLTSSCLLHAEPLDRLIRREQANVDNEAVSVYGGNAGKLDAIFHIEWAGVGNPVSGFYYYVAKGRKTVYTLSGNNPKEGVINLQEFTPSPKGGEPFLSANCRLTKRVTADRIIWEGTMNNIDGRSFPMKLSRPR